MHHRPLDFLAPTGQSASPECLALWDDSLPRRGAGSQPGAKPRVTGAPKFFIFPTCPRRSTAAHWISSPLRGNPPPRNVWPLRDDSLPRRGTGCQPGAKPRVIGAPKFFIFPTCPSRCTAAHWISSPLRGDALPWNPSPLRGCEMGVIPGTQGVALGSHPSPLRGDPLPRNPSALRGESPPWEPLAPTGRCASMECLAPLGGYPTLDWIPSPLWDDSLPRRGAGC